MKKQSKALTVIGLLFFFAGGISWFLFAILFTGNEHLAVPVAAALAAVGGFILILNAVINPDSISRPDIRPPEINIPQPVTGGFHQQQEG